MQDSFNITISTASAFSTNEKNKTHQITFIKDILSLKY